MTINDKWFTVLTTVTELTENKKVIALDIDFDIDYMREMELHSHHIHLILNVISSLFSIETTCLLMFFVSNQLI